MTMTTADFSQAAAAKAVPSMRRSFAEPRNLRSYLLTLSVWLIAIIASVPLFSVLYMLISQGGARLSFDLFTQLPPAGFMPGGGFGNAIIGTLVMVGIGSLISIPIGILGGIYLGAISPDSKLSETVRFVGKVLTGFPSILVGVFVFGALVQAMGTFSALAGGVALAIGMLPTVLLTSEQAIRMVPQRMKDAAVGIGCTTTQTVWKVVLPTALPGIMTGIMLGIASAAGESAPLLFTALFSNFWLESLVEPTASLSILIYNFSGMPFPNQIQLAWSASLVLVLIVLVFNILSRLFGNRKV
ncbi:phosphate transport system permease protein [Pseudochelatococcus lubricantis]|uniref:Phosphate transport system permease protein PstA n=1 Tax=Pseudochelatococcus lubricantis TaxID=1538102 RepID=A0ABX0V2W8_9HYPH|nr:phosphate ABC transporter permease PstA [Pseudochelatococcus lubricantis]NIJ59561.1 phosphate transport system permease protein [Pseudochelatococcus lubricantis]